ncbi:MAG: TldD/PmbA family protein [Erysipelotrichaceae bacterium]|nr:TldD/PmbA family protein [Erysipelotrichaceae bacterium]
MNKQLWIQRALEKGIECFEIYQSVQKEKTLTWFNGQVDTFVTSNVLGTSVRGIYEGNMANIALEDVKDDKMDEVLDGLIQQAQTITTVEKDALRKPETVKPVENSQTWIQPDLEMVKNLMKKLENDLMAYDTRIVQVASLGWQEEYSTREITNSYGIDLKDESTVQYLIASVVAQENDVVKDDYKIEVIHDLKDFDEEAFVKKLCEDTLFKLHSTSLSSRTCPVIFEKEAMRSLFSAFSGYFNGELIFKGISPIKDKLDQKIFSEQITIVDDPRNTDCLTVLNFDDEGCPTRRKVLVDHGVFTSMLHDTRSAIRMNSTSTGNGFKSGYASSVSVTPFNCCILPGEKSLEQMCQDMKEGLVITDLQGLHAGLDFVSGNFSLQCTGYWVKDGKKDHAVALITVADNFLKLMNKVVSVGNDLDWKYYSIATPSIAFTDCAISGE